MAFEIFALSRLLAQPTEIIGGKTPKILYRRRGVLVVGTNMLDKLLIKKRIS